MERTEVVHVAREIRDVGDARGAEAFAQPVEVLAFVQCDGAEVGEVVVERRQPARDFGIGGCIGAQRFGPRAQAFRRFVTERGVDPVHDQRRDFLVVVDESRREEHRFLHGVAAR